MQGTPFNTTDTSLRSIVSGVVAQDSVNVDQADEVGNKILLLMQGQDVTQYSFKRKQQTITLGSKTAVMLNKEAVHIDPQALFQRLTVVAARENVDSHELFKHELCGYPAALFESTGTPRQANKAVFASALWNEVKSHECSTPTKPLYVLDGGALLHRVSWSRGVTFKDICDIYVHYVTRKYGNCVIVFDGYSEEPSVKDMTHRRRGTNTVTVHCESNMMVTVKKEVFLGNKQNKQRFSNMLSEFFEQAGCESVHARGDADLIVQTAVAVSADRETIVVADDTDILVLLCHFVNPNSKAIFMKPESRHGSKEAKFWDIHVMKSILGDGLCKHLPFIHALLGCDTTSCLFGIGKALAMKKYSQLQQHAEMFCKPDTSQADIITSGEKALVVIYGGKSSDTLNTLRCHRFVEKMSRSTISIEMKALPPTSAQQSTIPCGYTTRCRCGEETVA